MSKHNQPRFSVWIGGGIGELHDVKFGLTFKQAVQAWVRGQKVAPTDVAIELNEEPEDWLQAEKILADVIRPLVAEHREWVEREFDKQHVYNRLALDLNNPFSRG